MQHRKSTVEIMIEEIPTHNHHLLIHPKPKIDLFNVIQNSYHPQQHAFEQHGYIYDKEYADHETQVYHRHPRKHTILFFHIEKMVHKALNAQRVAPKIQKRVEMFRNVYGNFDFTGFGYRINSYFEKFMDFMWR